MDMAIGYEAMDSEKISDTLESGTQLFTILWHCWIHGRLGRETQ